MLPQWHAKDPGHSAKNAGGRLALNTHTPLTQRRRRGLTMPFVVQAQCGNLSENELTRNPSGNTPPQSSQLAEPLWSDPGLKNDARTNLRFKNKKRGRGINGQTFSRNPHKRRRIATPQDAYRERESLSQRWIFLSGVPLQF